jgi:pimeloyl-ACP methyl ester carboxylesterase
MLCMLLLSALLIWTTTTPAAAFTAVSSSSSTTPQPLSSPPSPVCPKISPATGLANQFYSWKEGQQIRYQTTGRTTGPPVVLVHGLFVNSDHWRKTLTYFGQAGYCAYALDLFGCGCSDKPPAASGIAQLCNGETSRFDDDTANNRSPGILSNIELGTANGQRTRIVDVDLRHPLGSPYNFFTWADLIADFTRDIVLVRDESTTTRTTNNDEPNKNKMATIVCNSIGTISSLQAVLDHADLFRGVFVVCPNFRELHSAEIPLAPFVMPILRYVQQQLRYNGQVAFDALATPAIVKKILREPYAVQEAIDDVLVDVLLTPLLTEGASDVVFDTLSYSAGPLPEQQLQMFPSDKPVWICYGDQDPWTPGGRVDALERYSAVERVIKLPGVGHCPHDEAPELVHPLLQEFLDRLHLPRP